MENIGKKIYDLVSHLPKKPEHRIWFDGDEILCETEQLAENIADFLDAVYGEGTVNTGYYDPEEDERNNEVTETTGWYYVTIS